MSGASFYADSDAGHNVCKMVTGGDCDGYFSVNRFVPLRTLDGLKVGEVIVVALGDNNNFLSTDTRTLAFVWDDAVLMTTAKQEEGTKAQYEIRSVEGRKLTVWCDVSIPATITPMSKTDANKIIDDEDKSFTDTLTDVAKALQEQQNKILLGAAVVAIVLIIGAAYALANTKINPGIKVGL